MRYIIYRIWNNEISYQSFFSGKSWPEFMETFSRKKVIFWRGGVSAGLNLEKFSRSQAFKKDDFFEMLSRLFSGISIRGYFFQKNDLKIVFKKVIFWRVGCPQGWNKNSNGGLRVVILKSAWEKNKIRAKNITANGSILGLKWPQMTFWPRLIYFFTSIWK